MNTAEQIQQFVPRIYASEDVVEIRCLLKGEPKATRTFWRRARDLPGLIPELQTLNRRGLGIYAGANPRKGDGLAGDANVQTFRVLFVDFDKIEADGTGPSEIALGRIEAAGLPAPTLVVFSGHGIHAYWRLAEPIDEAQWRDLQQRLNQALGSDPTIKNPEIGRAHV
jgi:hypothetical protein